MKLLYTRKKKVDNPKFLALEVIVEHNKIADLIKANENGHEMCMYINLKLI